MFELLGVGGVLGLYGRLFELWGEWVWFLELVLFFDLKQVVVCLLKSRVVCGDVFI